MDGIAYFAVTDPLDPGQVTYWRRGKNGRIAPWPVRARYGPILFKSAVPKGLGGDRNRWVQDWYTANREPWDAEVRLAITGSPEECQARFSVFAIRCCSCGRGLTDPKSKTCGIGPECRHGLPEEALGRMARLVGRIHAQALLTQGDAA